MGEHKCPFMSLPSDLLDRIRTNGEALDDLLNGAACAAENLHDQLCSARTAFGDPERPRLCDYKEIQLALDEYHGLCEVMLNIAAVERRTLDMAVVDTGGFYLPTGGGFGDLRDD